MYNLRFIKTIITTGLVTSLLTACTMIPNQSQEPSSSLSQKQSLNHAYDYVLLNKQRQQINLTQAIKQLKEADIIFIGEYHGNHASHLLEMQVFSALHQRNANIILSMEMFNRDQQDSLNDYLDGAIGEAYLVKEIPAWNNYVASYRPLVEFAKSHFIPVIAANASADIVRCIGRQGTAYIDKLDSTEKQQIAKQPLAKIPDYKVKFYDFLEKVRQLPEERKERSYLAQITRDNTMAESIYQACLDHPEHKIVHLNGTFHSENHLGTVAALKRLNPKLNIQVVTPVQVEQFETIEKLNLDPNLNDDFIYLVKPQPEQYIDAGYKKKARKQMFEKSEQATCK